MCSFVDSDRLVDSSNFTPSRADPNVEYFEHTLVLDPYKLYGVLTKTGILKTAKQRSPKPIRLLVLLKRGWDGLINVLSACRALIHSSLVV
jgi:hypothetical protein